MRIQTVSSLKWMKKEKNAGGMTSRTKKTERQKEKKTEWKDYLLGLIKGRVETTGILKSCWRVKDAPTKLLKRVSEWKQNEERELTQRKTERIQKKKCNQSKWIQSKKHLRSKYCHNNIKYCHNNEKDMNLYKNESKLYWVLS